MNNTELQFFQLYKPYLTIEINNSVELPQNFKGIYSSDIKRIFPGLIFNSFIRSQYIGTQVVNLQNSEGFQIVLKRKSIFCNFNDKKLDKNIQEYILNEPNIQSFLNSGLKEHSMSRIISSHPGGVASFDFRITTLFKINTLVSEFVMEKAGIELNEFVLKKEFQNFDSLNYFKELVKIMVYLEKMNFAQSDIKGPDLLVDPQGHARLIDYDISQAGGLITGEKVFAVHIIFGYPRGYASPEALEFVDKLNYQLLKPNEVIDPWKSDVYSTGIVSMIIFKILTDLEHIPQLDSFKRNEKRHEILREIVKSINYNDYNVKSKIEFLLTECLEYDPTKRPSFRVLDKMMERIEDNLESIEKFKAKYYDSLNEEKKLNNKENQKIENLMEENLILKNQIELQENKISMIKYEINSMKDTNVQTLKAIEDSLKQTHIKNPNNISEIPVLVKDLIQEISFTGLKSEIQEELKKGKFWDFHKMKLNSEEILKILEIGIRREKLEGINFFSIKFDELTGKALYNFAEKNNSIIGIDIVDLNISNKQKFEIIKLSKIKKNIKFVVVEKNAIQEGVETILAENLGFEINNLQSKYYCLR